MCTCCSLCPGAVPFVFARPVSASPLGLRLDAAAPGSPAPSAGGSPACVSCECQGRPRGGGEHAWPGTWPCTAAVQLRLPGGPRPGAWPAGHPGATWLWGAFAPVQSSLVNGRKERGSDSRPNRDSVPHPPAPPPPQGPKCLTADWPRGRRAWEQGMETGTPPRVPSDPIQGRGHVGSPLPPPAPSPPGRWGSSGPGLGLTGLCEERTSRLCRGLHGPRVPQALGER